MASLAVVIPAYNPGELLRRALTSVVAQTFEDWECIVVDDGGKEDLSWVDELRDSRISRLRQANRGISVARNVGVETTSASLLAFLDQDDEWMPDKLERQLGAMAGRSDVGFCYTNFWWTTSREESLGASSAVTYPGLLVDQHVCLSSVIVPRDSYNQVGGHNPLMAQMQDYDLFLRLIMGKQAAVGIDDALVRYHLHGSNTSEDYSTARQERIELLKQHRRRALAHDDAQVVESCDAGLRRTDELFGAKAYDAARMAVKSGDVGGLRHFARAAMWAPAHTFRSLTRTALGR